jgi:Putative Actinobacterial Holin-X, holin superfamily III
MNKEVVGKPKHDLPQESLGDLFSQLSRRCAALVRDEVDLARQEVREKLSEVKAGLVLVAVGATVGFASLLVLCAAAVVGLAYFIGWVLSTLVIAIGTASIGAIILVRGLRLLKRTTVRPEKTIQTLKEGKEWLKRMT